MQNNPIVLLVDDDTDDQEIFSMAMERANKDATCVFAKDGMDALEQLQANIDFKPDFIFIDMNMPRMNGQQCLAEIKKIDRLRDIPVFMYSTSADPDSLQENIRLGASDFIVKPSNIHDLTAVLANILQKPLVALLMFIFFLSISPSRLCSQDELVPVRELKKLSVEELMNVVVTSVSRTPEKLTKSASAIQVVSGNDIRRSTSTRLPEALRLAPNLQVTQSGAHDWGITARGFNGAPVASSSLADKLLVMIDGRTVYTPLFGGVYWDVQNVMMEDIDRIEVVSGPGGTLWGSNAVNGVVNVITKTAKETQGLFVSAAAGTFLQDHVAARYGSQIDSALFFRVYGERYDYSNSLLANGEDARDNWNLTQGGFRMDFLPSETNTFTLQGEIYGGTEDEELSTSVNGQHLIGRWTRSFSNQSNIIIQSYLDRTFREIRNSPFTDELTTLDFELQHHFQLGKHNRILWGAGYRTQNDKTTSFDDRFTPADKKLELLSAFIQDQITIIPERFTFTIGSKFLENDYTGFEIQPSARLAWTPDDIHTLWGAVSRSVRTPSRFDVDLTSFGLTEHPDFRSEEVISYELGYHLRPFDKVSVSVATFYNVYDDLRSLNMSGLPEAPFYFGNDLAANTWGFEMSSNILISNWWRMRGGVTYLDKAFTIEGDNVVEGTELIEGIDPKGQVILQSIMDVADNVQIDFLARYISKLPAAAITQTPEIPDYFTVNARIGYEFRKWTFALSGQHLINESHTEFGTRKVPRSIYGKISFRL